MTIMLSESKLTNSHALPILSSLKSNLKNFQTDTRDLIKMKSLLRECLNFYITLFRNQVKKSNLENQLFLLSLRLFMKEL